MVGFQSWIDSDSLDSSVLIEGIFWNVRYWSLARSLGGYIPVCSMVSHGWGVICLRKSGIALSEGVGMWFWLVVWVSVIFCRLEDNVRVSHPPIMHLMDCVKEGAGSFELNESEFVFLERFDILGDVGIRDFSEWPEQSFKVSNGEG